MPNTAHYRDEAAKRLDPMVRDYYAGGAEDEETLRHNVTDWEAIGLIPRTFRDLSEIDLTTRLLGQRVTAPILTAPCSFNRLAHPDGELGVARAASEAGLIQVLSTASSTSLEEVAQSVPDGTRWFQLYCYRDRELTLSLVRRAEEAGYSALCLTVDVPVPGNRERDIHNGFHLPDDVRWANLDHVMGPEAAGSALSAYIKERWERDLSWATIGWLQAKTSLPLVIKGVMSAADAREAEQHGIGGIVVSNHGGRQLDGSISTCRALPAIGDAVGGGPMAVLVDGGIRRGSHVLKALALGADAVMIGRPYLWGLASDGQSGVTAVLSDFITELERAMALAGCRSIRECHQLEWMAQ
ncbi:MAG: alpha-hydroxy-acid oxidizing protein [Rhodothermales bacterium]|nr:alpha-hydroxy-acid oxidizing protein [Rhodothermales bacterium]